MYSFNPRMLPDEIHPKPVYRKLNPRTDEEELGEVKKKRKSRSAEGSPNDKKEKRKKPTKSTEGEGQTKRGRPKKKDEKRKSLSVKDQESSLSASNHEQQEVDGEEPVEVPPISDQDSVGLVDDEEITEIN